jgi:hypothetical protein
MSTETQSITTNADEKAYAEWVWSESQAMERRRNRKIDEVGIKKFHIELMKHELPKQTMNYIRELVLNDLKSGKKFVMKVWDANVLKDEVVTDYPDISKLPQPGDAVQFHGQLEKVISARLSGDVRPPAGYSQIFVEVLVDAQ